MSTSGRAVIAHIDGHNRRRSMRPDHIISAPAKKSTGSTKQDPFRPSGYAIVLSKAQRKALADLPGSFDYSVERTNIPGVIAAVATGSRSTVYLIAANGKIAEF